jgi:hypothetical protein
MQTMKIPNLFSFSRSQISNFFLGKGSRFATQLDRKKGFIEDKRFIFENTSGVEDSFSRVREKRARSL